MQASTSSTVPGAGEVQGVTRAVSCEDGGGSGRWRRQTHASASWVGREAVMAVKYATAHPVGRPAALTPRWCWLGTTIIVTPQERSADRIAATEVAPARTGAGPSGVPAAASAATAGPPRAADPAGPPTPACFQCIPVVACHA